MHDDDQRAAQIVEALDDFLDELDELVEMSGCGVYGPFPFISKETTPDFDRASRRLFTVLGARLPPPADVQLSDMIGRSRTGGQDSDCHTLRSILVTNVCKLRQYIANNYIEVAAIDQPDESVDEPVAQQHSGDTSTTKSKGGAPTKWHNLLNVNDEMLAKDDTASRAAIVNEYHRRHRSPTATQDNLTQARSTRKRSQSKNKN